MTTSTSWTLWKRLPPRYQLSVRTFVEEDEGYPCSPPGSPKQQRRGSPRHSRSENKSPRPQPPASPGHTKRSIQNIPYVDPTVVQTQERPTSGIFFPSRRSGYIDHFKTQQRVNSARVNMMAVDGIGRSRSPSPTGRGSRMQSHQENKPNTENELRCVSAKTRTTEGSIKKCEHQIQNANMDSKHDSQALHWNKMEQRKYLVRETDEGTMYIDRGKVIYFRSYKSSPVSQTPHMSRYNDGGYLASIRREYLTKPRLLAMGPDKKTEPSENNIHEERANYNRKVAHILDYYSYPDEDYLSVDDLTKYTSTNRRHNSPRKPIMNTRNVKRIYFAYPKNENESRVTPVQEFQHEMGSYFKVNQQSKLHDRNFYLKTPSHKSTFPEAELDCSCGMCRIEMQLALMAQAEAENLAKLQQSKMSKTRAAVPKQIAKITTTTKNDKTEVGANADSAELMKESQANDNKTQEVSVDAQKQTTVEDTKQEQTLTVTIPKMDTNREISEVAKENEPTADNSDKATEN